MIVITGQPVPSKKLRQDLARLPIPENGYFTDIDQCDQSGPWQQQDHDRPMDWQDRLVIGASVVVGAVCIFLLIWGPR